jgi:hypothetical protein
MARFPLSVLLAALLLAYPAAAAPRDPFLAQSFSGLGAWVDIFDGHAWADPEAVVADLDGRGVKTLYLQSASSRRGPAVFRPDRTARFLHAAHSAGIDVIAWYLPPHVSVAYETRRSLGAIRFVTDQGDSFDGFALDIETAPNSPTSASLRNRRMLKVSRRIRAAVGPWYPLGAITPSPVGLDLPHGRAWWPGFPWQALSRIYDAFLPMGYYTYHGNGAAAAYDETLRNFELLRSGAGDPDVAIHMIGGGGGDSTYAEGRAFTRAVNESEAIGASLYDYATMNGADWRGLRGLTFTP